MLVTASWVDEVRETLGITGVSQIWDEKPAWYFWVSGLQGAYQLQLESADIDEQAAAGVFIIKYYPSPLDRVFSAFSAEECALVQGAYFDHTNTPRYEKREQIPANLFNVASIIFSALPDNPRASLSFQALTTTRVVHRTGPGSGSNCNRRDRQVPSWELGFALFERLVGLYAFYSKKTPARIALSRSPGFEYIVKPGGEFQCVDTTDIHAYSLSIFFGDGDPHIPWPGSPPGDWMKDDLQEKLFDRIYDPLWEPARPEGLPGLKTAVNPSWWELARACYASSLASTCGCGHDEGGACVLLHDGK